MTTEFRVADTPIRDGVQLIEASAGTGKTYTITGLVLRLLLERELPIGKILVVTFTRAATEELKGRILKALEAAIRTFDGSESDPDPLHVALAERHGEAGRRLLAIARRDFDDVPIATIHGFCQRVLDRNAFESASPFAVDLIDDDRPLQRRLASDFWRRSTYACDALLAAWIVASKLTPELLLRDWQTARQAPRTRLSPKPVPLPDAVRRADQARRELMDAWPRESSCLRDVQWKKSPRVPEDWLDCVDRFVAGELAFVQDACRLADAPKLAFKRSIAQLDGAPATLAAATALAESMDACTHALRAMLFETLDSAIDEEKDRLGVLGYDDLLRRLQNALREGAPGRGALIASLQTEYRAALIDEFQDTDLKQWEIFRAVFVDLPFFLIGDPKQAIYGFRGADVQTYLRAAREANDRYTLTTNWRSQPRLIDAVNALFRCAKRPFVVDAIEHRDVAAAPNAASRLLDDRRGALHWMDCHDVDARLVPTVVANECVRLLTEAQLDGKDLTPDRIAVLVRSNWQATDIQDALRLAGIPSVIGKGGEIFKTEEMEELARVIAAIAQPRNDLLVRAAWSTRIWGSDADALNQMTGEQLEETVAFLETCRSTWHRDGLFPAVEQVLMRRGTRERLLALRGGERRVTNLLHALELVHAEAAALSPDGLLRWLRDALEDSSDIDAELRELRLESDESAVQVLTMHRSKGLEFDVVFCPYLWNARPAGTPVLFRDEHHSVLDCAPDDGALVRGEVDRYAEDARLTYVAVTRAKQRCYILWCKGRGQQNAKRSGLAYLLHQPEVDSADPSSWIASVREAASVEGVQAAIHALAERHSSMTAETVTHVGTAQQLEPKAQTTPLRRCRFPRHRVLQPWRLASFTSLTRGAGDEAGAAPERADPERQIVDLNPASAVDGILAFALGRAAGVCLHELLENADFRSPGSPANREMVTNVLTRHDLLDPERHRAPIDPVAVATKLLRDVASAPLPFAESSLGEVDPEHRIDEWQFHLPLRDSGGEALPAAFEQARDPRLKSYAQRLAGLPDADLSSRLTGYMTGWVDCIANVDGRYWVLDWKSNWLGDRQQDYDDASLLEAMSEHHYLLQANLYLVALHRFLSRRLTDYRPETHLGGAAYVFLRDVRQGSQRGFFVQELDRPLLAALENWVGAEVTS